MHKTMQKYFMISIDIYHICLYVFTHIVAVLGYSVMHACQGRALRVGSETVSIRAGGCTCTR